MSDGSDKDPAVNALIGGVIWGLIALWIASYWYSGTELWLIAGGAGAGIALLVYVNNRHVQKLNRAYRAKSDAQFAEHVLRATLAAAKREPLPQLSSADMELVEQLVRAYPGYLPRREGVVRDVGREL